MPRTLTFRLNGEEMPANLVVFSRDSIYGQKHIERRGEHDALYQMADLTSDGTHIIPSGGSSYAYMDCNGCCTPKKDTRILDEKKEPLYVTKSMYSYPIELGPTISLKHYFDYIIERTYLLELEHHFQIETLLKECTELLNKNKFARFTYAYYDTPDPQDAILIPKEDQIFVAVGTYHPPVMLEPTQIEYWDEEEIDMEQELIEFDVW